MLEPRALREEEHALGASFLCGSEAAQGTGSERGGTGGEEHLAAVQRHGVSLPRVHERKVFTADRQAPASTRRIVTAPSDEGLRKNPKNLPVHKPNPPVKLGQSTGPLCLSACGVLPHRVVVSPPRTRHRRVGSGRYGCHKSPLLHTLPSAPRSTSFASQFGASSSSWTTSSAPRSLTWNDTRARAMRARASFSAN